MYKRRCYIIFLVFIICFSMLVKQIINLQYKKADELSVIADSQYKYKENKEELNYKLLDCNGKDLLEYNKKYKAVIIPNVFIKNNSDTEYEEFLKLLYILKSYDSDYDLTDKKYLTSSQKLYFDIDKVTYEKLKEIKGVKGFYTFEYSQIDRSKAWKIENIITNTKNASDGSLKNKDSFEMNLYNKMKSNKIPQIEFNIDIDGNIKENTDETKNNNKNLKLTLDKDLQEDVKEILKTKYNKYEQIGVILMESDTGNIKAMVQKEDTLPNINIGAETLNGFFPGSIFKTIVLEGVLEQQNISLYDEFNCNGHYESKKNKEVKGHGELTVEEAFIVSCNDIYSQLGIKVGSEKICELAESQGLFNKVLGLDREQIGALEVKNPKKEDGSLGITSIGQNIRITPLEAISIVNTAVNKGKYVKPNIIDSYIDANNKVIERVKREEKVVISESNANIVKETMKKVVEMGTGRAAGVQGVQVGGKTGSTERIEIVKNKNNENEKKQYSDGWFIGYFKYKEKYYSMVVFVKNIDKDLESGGSTAAPIFRDVVEKIIKK